jgi:uncharacterized membrane protein YhaH (DUF805 family)
MQQLPPPTCLDSFRLGFQNYCNFNGRARRSEYFYFFLIIWVINTILFYGIFIAASDSPYDDNNNEMLFLVLWFLFSAITLVPELSLTVRRLHDTGRSGWYVLFLLLSIIGVCILLIFLCEDSQNFTNEYGPSPKYVQPPGAVVTQTPAYVPPPVVVTPVVVAQPIVSIPVVQPVAQPPYPQVVPNQAYPLQPYEGYNSADIAGQ